MDARVSFPHAMQDRIAMTRQIVKGRRQMKNIPESDRTCRFRCVLTLVGDGLEDFAGVCEGKFLFEPKGTGGFGYDLSFYQKSESTFAISLEEKAKMSHRARALSKLIDWISGQ